MAEYTVEVNSIAEARLTGVLGTAVVTYRNHKYRIALGGRESTRDGTPFHRSRLPDRVWQFAVRQHAALYANSVRISP